MISVSRLPVILTVVVGTLVSLAAAALSASWERRVDALAFQRLAEDHLSVINTDLEEATYLLDTLRAFMEATRTPVDRPQFARFTGSLHGRTVGLRDTGWAPRVPAADRAAFERMVEESGFPGFRIRELDAAGKMVTAGERAEYFPILYVDAPGGVGPLLGLDLAGEPLRRQAIQRAVDTGHATAAGPLTLVTVHRPRGGLVAFVPVSRSASATEGLVFGGFDIHEMIDTIVSVRRHLNGLKIYLFDPARPMGDRLIDWHARAAPDAAPPEEAALRALPHWESHIDVVDQRWGALLVPDTATRSPLWTRSALLPLFVGLLLTATVVAYLITSIRRTSRLETLTVTLRKATQRLHQHAKVVNHLARHDALTGLPNRRAFSDQMVSAIGRAARGGRPCAVLLIDLDRFKPINDVHGHAAGDHVLCEVATRLRSEMRAEDVVARLGGDEFAAIVDCDERATSTAKLANRLVTALREPILFGETPVEVGASVGVALYPRDGATAAELLQAADQAMYRAKRGGRGRYVHFDRSVDTQVCNRTLLLSEVRQAVAAGQIQPYLQPLIRLQDGVLVGVEILARWLHPERGVITPAAFIPIADDAGLLPQLTCDLLRQVCAAATTWPKHLFITLNLAPSQLASPALQESLLAILAEAGLPPHRLEIEVTEAALIQEDAGSVAVLRAIRAAGIRVALDDFGTGRSGLGILRELPFDTIKIDRAFVMSMTTDPACATIVEAIAGLGRSFGARTAAEGIEDAATLARLKALGVQTGQGFHYGAPVPLDDVDHELGRCLVEQEGLLF